MNSSSGPSPPQAPARERYLTKDLLIDWRLGESWFKVMSLRRASLRRRAAVYDSSPPSKTRLPSLKSSPTSICPPRDPSRSPPGLSIRRPTASPARVAPRDRDEVGKSSARSESKASVFVPPGDHSCSGSPPSPNPRQCHRTGRSSARFQTRRSSFGSLHQSSQVEAVPRILAMPPQWCHYQMVRLESPVPRRENVTTPL